MTVIQLVVNDLKAAGDLKACLAIEDKYRRKFWKPYTAEPSKVDCFYYPVAVLKIMYSPCVVLKTP